MKASIVDLRYHMNDVLKALNRNEPIEILYHNKKIGIIQPLKKIFKSKLKVKDHAFYGMNSQEEVSVAEQMKQLRGGRYNDL